MHDFPDLFWPDLLTNIISYYTHKISYFGKTFCQKNEVINAKIYWMDTITENFVRAYWTKCKLFLNQYAKTLSWKAAYGWMDNITKKWEKIQMECSVITQKQPISKISVCCSCSSTSWLLVGCNCKIQTCWLGAVVTTITNWSGASATDSTDGWILL